MVFRRTLFRQRPSQILTEDRFREVELAISFKRLACPRCHFEGIYKYWVQQVRRRPEIQIGEGEEVRDDHLELWRSIPRFAEIPETVKCKRCKEKLDVDVLCLY